MLTLANIWDLLKTETSDLFSDIIVPDSIDKDILTDRIMEECGNMVSIWSSAAAFKHYSDAFFRRNLPRFKKIADTTLLTYDALENYNMFEDMSRSTASGTDSAGTSTSLDSHYSFDAGSTAQPVNAGESGNTTSVNSTGSETTLLHRHGNIGVTTSSKLLDEYRETAMYDVYNTIVELYADNMFLGIY